MKLGMIGLGRMGGNMAERLRNAGHVVIGYDRDPAVSGVKSLHELVDHLPEPRIIWVMVPAGEPTDRTMRSMGRLLSPGDIVVNGGNSHYNDDIEYSRDLSQEGIGFIDAGVSGGIWGLRNGCALMVGGSDENVRHLMPIFGALKPEGEYGFVHAGTVGAGHFAKMVHNGIEYGMMQAFAEGWELLQRSDLVSNVPEIFRSWREGTVIRSWLLDLADRALRDDPDLAGPRDSPKNPARLAGWWRRELNLRYRCQ